MAKKAKYHVRKDGLHESIRTINGKRVAFRGKTDKEVDRKILEYREEEERGRTVGKVADEWQAARESEIMEATRVAYKAPLARLLDEMGDRCIRDVKPIQLERLLLDMQAKGYSFGTVKLTLSIIKQVFRWAVVHGDIDVSPAAELRTPRGLPRKERDSLTAEQIRAVTEYRGEGWLLGLMLLYTGCRRGELLALRYEDIDRKAGTITINKKISFATGQPVLEHHTKTDAGMRTIPLLSPVAEALPKNSIGPIFHEDDGGYLKQHHFSGLFRAVCDGCGLFEVETIERGSAVLQVPKYTISPHWFRHTFATICYDAGVDAKSAAAIMGHADESITIELYTHLTRSREQKSAEKLEAFIKNGAM